STLPEVFPLYLKTNWDGKNIKSVSATLRNDDGEPIGLMCINLEISKWEEMHHFLGEWIGNVDLRHQPKVLFKDDWKEKINHYVSQYLKTHGFTLRSLNKEKKQALILALQHEGAFKAKNAATYVGEVLDLSRATIYNYLKNHTPTGH
ncbi:MAG: helix-turn-helix domain-containing protein, partial [Parachlamydiaceae bacterium]|nr:helix-turn-helix domain-containing protein [Parachlamydiaceae bacterium]